jgi:hypothetical protein
MRWVTEVYSVEIGEILQGEAKEGLRTTRTAF